MVKEATFRSPGFFAKEIDRSARQEAPFGVPAGVIGTALRGPAFVPTTVGSSADFESRFGPLDPNKPSGYAVEKYTANRPSVTFMRVLGAGSNDTTGEIETTRLTGQVVNAGFVVTGTETTDFRTQGCVQFLCARHEVQTNEVLGMPIFTDNDSFSATGESDEINLVRAAVFMTSGSRFMVLDGDQALPAAGALESEDDVASLDSSNNFKLVLSSTNNVSVLTASLNPDSSNYIGKILNKNPDRFAQERHLLYMDFAVDDQIATVATSSAVAILSGTENTSDSSGNTDMIFRDAFGHYDARFTSAKTTPFISQPFGDTEYDLFHLEALDDGEYPNLRFKASIANLRGSTNPSDPYGTFEVQIRDWSDTDTDQNILERFPGCNLDPTSENYVANKIGDMKRRYAFDADSEDERRIIVDGTRSNKSTIVRAVMNEQVERQMVPAKALPFGFRGIPVLNTNDTLSDSSIVNPRLGGSGSIASLSSSLLPPMPYRFKVTRGSVATTGFAGNPGVSEEVDGRFYWGSKLERNLSPLNSNTSGKKSGLASAYSKFQGLQKLDILLSGSSVDTFNENKFTLARVAFSNGAVSDLTGTVAEHMKEAAYIRNGNPDATNYTVTDGVLSSRITLATLVNLTSSVDFNRFQTFNKFTNPMYGGFDGLNILDKNAYRMNDKGSSSDSGGGAASGYVSPGLAYNPAGAGKDNNAVFSYVTAARILTDPFTLSSNGPGIEGINILAIPGIKDSFVTDQVAQFIRDYALAIYLMDIPSYSDSNVRLFDDDFSTTRPDVARTADQFDSRAIDNNYVATYFPDVTVEDTTNNRRVRTPASVAALAAIGFNDRVGFPWFAPAGFNRGALDFVTNLSVRLTVPDRDKLYDARINPIANFPNEGFVIFGQKTLQQAQTALDRVNVRRLLLEVKRSVARVARNLVFEQVEVTTRNRFVSQVTPLLGLIQSQSGIETFRVIMDDTNNSQADEEQNRINGTIIIIPTRAIDFIAVDFVVTNAGVSFNT